MVLPPRSPLAAATKATPVKPNINLPSTNLLVNINQVTTSWPLLCK